MFRALTRKNKQLPLEDCIRLLITETRGILSVLGDGGYPYGMPMNHWYNEADGCIYFHTGKSGHRLDALAQCDKVSLCVYDRGTSHDGEWALTVKSVIVFGRINIIDDTDTVIDITAKLSRKFTADEDYIRREIELYGKSTILLRLTPEHICGKLVTES
ncbi:MAG: pyridoxamine 5'-phosphate oxidase family protein [Clostridia bacterium]|nr:pyridoxamine 5'-phosphate oxidase family protein [Clostridia bacterium]